MVDIYSKIAECRAKGKDAVVVTVTEKEGMSPSDVGKKMIVSEDNEAWGTIGGGSIEWYAREKCKEILLSRKSLTEKYVLMDKDVKVDDGEIKLNMACGGKATLFYEFIGPKQYIYIFGGGHCGAAIAKLLKPLNYYVTIIDERKEVIDALDDSADAKLNIGFVEFFDKYSLPDNRYIVVSTPSHQFDYAVLDQIFKRNIKPAYFGMLCSKKKIVDYLDKIYAEYGKEKDLSNFYSPIGLDIGGDSPEEVALSVVGEINAHFYEKDKINSHMRNRVPEDKKYF